MENQGEQPVEEEEPGEAPPLVAAVEARPEQRPDLALAPYVCNYCMDYVRGGVVTICGHLFCWICLWPILSHQEIPMCPRCMTPLLVHDDIVPFYGEGPNSRPEDSTIPAEPGAVPRPAGIRLSPPQGARDQAIQMVILDRQFYAQPAQRNTLFPRIAVTLKVLKWVQVVCAIMMGVICFFITVS